MTLPAIIQGGMGAGVSRWQLAQAVSRKGHLGVVSGTALDNIIARRLQIGDPGGHVRRALRAFPVPDMAERILTRYFIEGGKSVTDAFKAKAAIGHHPPAQLLELLVVSNFIEVFLAKDNHNGLVGINFLEKIQTPILPSLYGAMLADVDVVIMGAGIPKYIPECLDELSQHKTVQLKLNVVGASNGASRLFSFDPKSIVSAPSTNLRRPLFFPIVASATLANMLVKKSNGRVDGLIIEGPTAGGHNAPPRGKIQLDEGGEPIYSTRDEVDSEDIKKLGLPFWLAGSYGTPERLNQALNAGAAGIQVGTLFAFCEESGLSDACKRQVIELIRKGQTKVFTDPLASPSGYPFKVLSLANSNSEAEQYQQRQRVCDLGYLREAFEKQDGSLGWRCPAEPEKDFVRKGGKPEHTVGRKCLCNGLLANLGLGQRRNDGSTELPLITCGDDIVSIARVLQDGKTSYSASEAIQFLEAKTPFYSTKQL